MLTTTRTVVYMHMCMSNHKQKTTNPALYIPIQSYIKQAILVVELIKLKYKLKFWNYDSIF